jgi:hypothetical protein
VNLKTAGYYKQLLEKGGEKMSRKFAPVDVLRSEEIELLRRTKLNIKRAKTKKELEYYQSIFQALVKNSADNLNKNITSKEEHERSDK